MSSKLTVANPYLREPAVRERTVLKSVATSSAIEGIRAPFRKIKPGGIAAKAKGVASHPKSRKAAPRF